MGSDKEVGGGSDDNVKKTISIRGIDKNLYSKLSAIAKEVDKTIGELVNEAIDLFVKVTDGVTETVAKVIHEPYIIKNLDKLVITGDELRGLDRPVMFLNIRELILEDLDDDALDRIVKVMKVDKVLVKGSVNKVKLYSRFDRVGNVEVHEMGS
ncbi:TPA: hypothetical protein EYP83_03325 [Candidatus Geothermarchaeota archaeon]|nr:hypothetical protein [Candidatus Geothermarchaeota archaeon]HIQ13868.1 hypothetical protein [Thermoprotei archaeon]